MNSVSLTRIKKALFSFHTAYTSYLWLLSILGAIVIHYCDNISYLDSIFLTVSAVSGTGLFTVSMSDLSTPSFVTLAVVMFLGGIVFLLVPPIAYRRHCYKKIRQGIKDNIQPDILKEYDDLYRALGVTQNILIAYLALFHIVGSIALAGALYLHPNEPELEARGYNRWQSAVFLTISSFANAGYALSSTSVFYLKDNPLAYMILCIFILAGNTAIPVILRWWVIAMIKLAKIFKFDSDPYQFVLDNPRLVTTQIFAGEATRFLGFTILGLNLVQYVFFLGSCLTRHETLDTYGSKGTLAGMGVFQTISTRSAGLQIMDLRTMNEGMLMVYCLMMYLSSAPFVGELYDSEQSANNRFESAGMKKSIVPIDSSSSTSTIGAHRRQSANIVDPISSEDNELRLAVDVNGEGLDLISVERRRVESAIYTDKAAFGRASVLSNTLPRSEEIAPMAQHVESHRYDLVSTDIESGLKPSAMATSGDDNDGDCDNNENDADNNDSFRNQTTNNGNVSINELNANQDTTVTTTNDYNEHLNKNLPMKAESTDSARGSGIGGTLGYMKFSSIPQDVLSEYDRQLGNTTSEQVHRTPAPHRQSFAMIKTASMLALEDIKESGNKVRSKLLNNYVLQHTFFIILAVFISSFVEDAFIKRVPGLVNVFYITFEIVSAYGNVGLSLSLPGESYSLSGDFHPVTKIILMLVMMLGKHRGLPTENDAVIDFSFKRFRRAAFQRKNATRHHDIANAIEALDKASMSTSTFMLSALSQKVKRSTEERETRQDENSDHDDHDTGDVTSELPSGKRIGLRRRSSI